ncbi:LamG-like jellyroll fold domain-containing protein, partial [Algibacter sp.]|uniref:LamG-like jellyroll fold domain-containing protein n=1 Tax=Algibacter sp. TaxID=1872428 RepID=UPI003C775DDF
PGSSDDSVNHNPVWVTPTANTTLYIKYDGDFEDATASTSPCGIPYDQAVTLNALNYTKIFDTVNADNDQSGLSVYTCDGTKIFAVYGQDASLASSGSPSMDVGTTMQPLCLNPLIFANDDVAYGLIDTPININVADNDTAFLTTLNPGSIVTTELLQPTNGVIVLNADGTVTYTPNEGFDGVDTFEYSICSLEFPDVCDSATVIINISTCAIPPNKNIIYGQVFFDLNEDTINNDDIGEENIDINIYNDVNNNGIVDAGDMLLNTVTTNEAGFYDYEVEKINVAIEEDFSSSNYSGGTGWSTNWTEVSDDGNSGSGAIQIEGSKKRLLVRDDSGAYRSVNLAGVTNANISFDIREYGTLESSDDVLIQICSDNTFSSCQTIFAKADDFNSETINSIVIDADKLTATTTLRVQANGYTSGSERFYIDNILIRYEVTTDNFVLETDLSSYPAGFTFSTDNVEVANFPSGSTGNCEKNNDFGVLRCYLTESGLIFNCNDNGTPLETSDDTYTITLDPDGTRIGATYTVSGDLTGTGTYGTPLAFGPFLVSTGSKTITITDNTGNCEIEDVEINVSQYSCLNLTDDYTIDFDGVDDYLTGVPLIQGLGEVTIMAWVKIGSGVSAKTIVSEDVSCRLYIKTGNKPNFSIRTNSGLSNILESTGVNLYEWHHITGTFSSATGTQTLYVDGKLEATFTNASYIGETIEADAS